MKSTGKIALGLAIAALAVRTASAGLTWDSVTTLTTRNDTSFQTNTAIADFNLRATGSGTTVWGETWNNVAPSGATVGGISIIGGSDGSHLMYSSDNQGLYSSGTSVLNTSWYNNNTVDFSSQYVTLSGFNPALQYQIQFLVVDSRSGLTTRQSMMRVVGGGNDSGIATPIGNTDVSSFVVFSATLANASSISIQPLLSGPGTPNWNMTQLDAVRITQIPEPSTLLLLSLFSVAGFLRRRMLKQ